MFGQPGFGGSWSSSRRRGPLTGPALIFGLIAVVIFVIIAITVVSHLGSSGFGTPDPSGPCVGGPIMGQAGQSIGNGNYRFNCADGGSTVVHMGN